MSKETFYNDLMHTDKPMQEVFESYTNDDYKDLAKYISTRVRATYAFPNNDPEMNGDKPIISTAARDRFSIFSRTLDEGAKYTRERLELAKSFLASKNSEVLEG